MSDKKRSLFYPPIKWLVKTFYPKIRVEGVENLPAEPALIVGNHCKMNGPIACELYMPGKRYTWCAGEMMNLKEVPAYAYRDFWSRKPAYIRWFYRLLSYLIAPLAVLIFNNASTIGVYRDTRVMSTFRSSVSALCDGAKVIIFPECDEKKNHILYRFQEGFVDLARMYQRKTKRECLFVPMYIAPSLRKMYIGKPVRFDETQDIDQERKRICDYLTTEITNIALSLPRHTIIPYPNIPRKLYPKNIPDEV